MKKFFVLGLLLITVGFVYMKRDTLMDIYTKYLKSAEIKKITLGTKNNYYRNYNFNYVQNTTNVVPESKQDILNIYYTAINYGNDDFTFYCPDDYKNCQNEIKELASNQDELSQINNFVHPYNSFKHIETEYNSLGKVHITVEKNYTTAEIEAINAKIDNIKSSLILEQDKRDNIKRIHDYIINNSKYDSARSDKNIITYKSDIAYGTLIEGYGLCGGYSDAMELFLEQMGIKSFKVSSSNHVWNAVLLDNKWYNLDLTWDDPVTTDNSDYLDDSFFLISTNKLLTIEKEQHNFNQDIYSELKEA